MEAAVEALLFASGEAVPIADLARVLGVETAGARTVCGELGRKLSDGGRGIELTEIDGAFQLRTNPRFYDTLRSLVQNTPKRALSTTLLETLAIIAYRQPVTKAHIEEIRGVDAKHAVNKLMEYGLVCEKGRGDQPGKPILLGTTDDFLRFYGFVSPDDLPALVDVPENNGTENNRTEIIGQLEIE
jgi:segregation and condensation protein B